MSGWPPLLDTGIVVHYARNRPLSDWIEERYHLIAAPDKPFISVITHGELLALALKWRWGEAKLNRLEEQLSHLVILDINEPEVLRSYSETDDYCRMLNLAVNMQKNDLWIAATAHAFGVTLITTDRVFEHLHPEWVNVIYVDERVVKP